MIIIYGKNDCVWCNKAIDKAIQYELDFEYRNVTQFEEYKKELLEALPGCNTVPQIFWYGKHIGGYEDFINEIENTRNYGDGKI